MVDPTIATVCANCHWKPSDARYTPWWSWLCHHESAKLERWFNPVNGQFIADPPFRRCKDINQGACPNWQQSTNVLGLRVPSDAKGE